MVLVYLKGEVTSYLKILNYFKAKYFKGALKI